MSRIHPTETKTIAAETTVRDDKPRVFTVWKKSSMGFQGADGFSVYNSAGNLVFRLDNYSRRQKFFTGELVLMDGYGKPLLTLRPQIMSMYDQWNGYASQDYRNERSKTKIFSMRRASIIPSSDDAELTLTESQDKDKSKSQSKPCFTLEGCFVKRCCKIWGSSGEEAARISRKTTGKASLLLGDDVFSLVIQPGFDCTLIMASLVIMDRIYHKPFGPLLCS